MLAAELFAARQPGQLPLYRQSDEIRTARSRPGLRAGTTSSRSSASAAWAPSTRPGTLNWVKQVAVKVIRPEIADDPIARQDIERRFKRELLLARQITHKNVVRIHDLGEIEGIKYITMTYVIGSDLATILKEEGTAASCARTAHRARRRLGSGLGASGGRRAS